MNYEADHKEHMATLKHDDNVTPFPGAPAANVHCSRTVSPSYGLQPGGTALIQELAMTIDATIAQCQPHALAAAAKASLRGYICEAALLNDQHRRGSIEQYTRHLLYADPARQFSILAIVWHPGQRTAIHGHTAWGAVGIYSGNPYCETFATEICNQPRIKLEPTMLLRLHPGDLATVQPGIDDAHRLGNDSNAKAITIHIYGRDLLASPGSINITLN